jgi:hypothetical protein
LASFSPATGSTTCYQTRRGEAPDFLSLMPPSRPLHTPCATFLRQPRLFPLGKNLGRIMKRDRRYMRTRGATPPPSRRLVRSLFRSREQARRPGGRRQQQSFRRRFSAGAAITAPRRWRSSRAAAEQTRARRRSQRCVLQPGRTRALFDTATQIFP